MKSFFGPILALTLSLGLAQVATAATVNLVQNGSFEMGPAVNGNVNNSAYGANWDIWDSIPNWEDTSGLGIEAQTAGTVGLTPQDGNIYLELDTTTNSGITQSLNLGVGKYLLSFWYSPRVPDGANTNGISYALSDLLSGAITGPGSNPVTAVGAWTQVKHEFFISTASIFDLNFSAIGVGEGVGGFLDNVQVSAVPVPAAGLLLVGALGALVALRRRTQRAV